MALHPSIPERILRDHTPDVGGAIESRRSPQTMRWSDLRGDTEGPVASTGPHRTGELPIGRCNGMNGPKVAFAACPGGNVGGNTWLYAGTP